MHLDKGFGNSCNYSRYSCFRNLLFFFVFDVAVIQIRFWNMAAAGNADVLLHLVTCSIFSLSAQIHRLVYIVYIVYIVISAFATK